LCYFTSFAKRNGATIALLIVFLLLPIRCTMAQDSTSLFLSGIKMNDGRPYGMLGWVKDISARFQMYTVADVGGNNAALAELVHVRIYKHNSFTLLLNIGPNLELITADPDFTDHDAYLSAATGATLQYDLQPSIQLHAGIMWLNPAHPPKPFKLFIGIALPLQE